MTYILLYSLLTVFVAAVWSVLLVRRARDWRIFFLTGMLLIMAVRLMWTLLEESQIRPLAVSSNPREITEPLLGMLALLAMVFLGRLLADYRRAETDARSSEQRYRGVVEDQTEYVVRWQSNGALSFVNAAYCRSVGQPREALIGMTFAHALLDGGRSAGFTVEAPIQTRERRVFRPDGSVGWEEWTDRALFDGEGRLAEFQSVGRDITKRKVAEEGLVRAQSLLRAAIEQVPAGILIADAPDGTVRIANSAALAIRGPTSDALTDIPLEFHPKNWQTYRPDGTPFAPEELPLWRAIVLGETCKNMDLVIRRSNGDQRWVLTNAAPVRSADGRIIAGVAVFPDITERRETDAALHRANQALASHMNNSPLAMIEWDSDWCVKRWSAQAERMFGWQEEDVLGKPWQDINLAPEEGLQDFKEVTRRLLSGRDTDHIDYHRNRTRSGQEIHCEWYHSALKDNSGRLLSILSLVHDVSGRRRTEEERQRLAEQLRQSQKMEALGQLAGGVAHDFNNLLTAINGNTEMLQALIDGKNGRKRGEFDQALGQIRTAGERGAALTRQLLAFSRKEILHSEIIDPARAVSEMEDMLRRLIGAHIDLRVKRNGSASWVLVDPGQMQQIIMNLVVNAADAMPKGGALTIELDSVDHLHAKPKTAAAVPRTGRYVKLVICDTGTGMSDDIKGHIFEPFYTTKPVGKGTGLGLSTVYGAVSRLGGHIEVESELGRGATFTIFLPAVEAPMTSTAALRPAQAGRGEVVLICEDEDLVRDVTERLLRKQGYVVLTARDGRHALEVVKQHDGEIDLLISDVVMPDMNGRELADTLGGILPDMAVLFVSGYTADVIDDHGLDQDGVEFLYKPFVPRELLARVRQLLERPGEGVNGG